MGSHAGASKYRDALVTKCLVRKSFWKQSRGQEGALAIIDALAKKRFRELAKVTA